MAEFEASVPSTWTQQRTFAYLADFRCVQEWDPGISSSRLSAGAAGAQGAVYDVTFTVAGKDTTIAYTAVEVREPDRIVMRGETDSLISLDTITVSARAGRVEVHYRAELDLKGVRKVADQIANLGLRREGKKAAAGLEEKLASPP